MTATPQAYVRSMNEAARTRQWEHLSELSRCIYQCYSDKLDWDGLEAFFAAALQLGVPEEVRAAVARTAENLPEILANLAVALDKAVAMAALNAEIRGLYCEYFYDGGDASTIDLFPCTRFDRKDDFWASEFDEVIEGSLVQEYFRYDPDLDLPPPIDLIADDYLQAKLFAALGRLVCERVKGIPFGFAQHDHPIVYVEALPPSGLL